MIINNSQKALSLYLAVIIMAILLSLALGVAAILFGQMKIMEGMGDSVMAFYAANTGIERTLYAISHGAGVGSHFEETLENGSSYSADIIAPGADCSTPNYCIKSIGIFQGTKRAIRVGR